MSEWKSIELLQLFRGMKNEVSWFGLVGPAGFRVMVKIMETADRITLIIEGLPEDEGRVRFATFMTQLQNLSATLAKLDRDFELPDWDDLRGRAPNATGDLSSEDFVREMRDAW
jgi:hypothetical protein